LEPLLLLLLLLLVLVLVCGEEEVGAAE